MFDPVDWLKRSLFGAQADQGPYPATVSPFQATPPEPRQEPMLGSIPPPPLPAPAAPLPTVQRPDAAMDRGMGMQTPPPIPLPASERPPAFQPPVSPISPTTIPVAARPVPPTSTPIPPAAPLADRIGGVEDPTGTAVNPGGYSGRFQFGTAALQAAGVYQPAQGEDLKKNEWKGVITLPDGRRMSHEEFVKDPTAQRAAWQAHDANLTREIQTRGLDRFVGQTVAGIPVTEDAVKAAMHIGGPRGAQQFFETGGQYNPADDNGTTISAYIQMVQGGGRPGGGARAPGAAAPPGGTPPPGDPVREAILRSITGGETTREDMMKLIGGAPPVNSTRNVLLALASGLLSGPTFGQGLGKGLQGVLGLEQGESQNVLARAKTLEGLSGAQANRLLALGRLDQGQERIGVARDGQAIAGRRADQGDLRLQQQATALDQGQQKLALDIAKFGSANDPNLIGQRELAKADAKTWGAAAATAQKGLLESSAADATMVHDIEQAISKIGQVPELMGSTLVSRAKRAATDMGFIGDANDVDMLRKVFTGVRNESLHTLFNGSMGSIRSNAELKNLSGALADVTTSPEAAKWILEFQKHGIERRMAWRNHMESLDPAVLQGRGYFTAQKSFMDGYDKAHPMPSYRGAAQASGATPAAVPPAARRPTSGSIGGITWEATP